MSNTHISLHVVEELLDALEFASQDYEDSVEPTVDDLTVLAVQSLVSAVQSKRQTLKLLAQIGKQQVLILVDSGNIGTFVSDNLVQTLQLPTEPSATTSSKLQMVLH